MSDQGCLICFVSDFPGQKSARFHQTKWKIAKPGAATFGAPFLFERRIGGVRLILLQSFVVIAKGFV